MWEEIYIWIEQYAGVSYDVSQYIRDMKGDAMFLNPVTWKNNLAITLQCLSDMVDIIDEKWREIPEELPPRDTMKKFVTSEILAQIIEIINSIKQRLNIEPVDIRTFATLEKHVDGLYDLIRALSENTMEQLMKKEWYDEYEDQNNDFLLNVFGISKNDLPSMQFTVNDIKQMHSEDDDE